MDNSVTLFLLFSYSAIMGLIAFKILIYDRMKAENAHKSHKPGVLKFKKDRNMLEKLTDPVFNAQYEINRTSKRLNSKTENNVASGDELKNAVLSPACPDVNSCEALAESQEPPNKAPYIRKYESSNEEEEIRYEIDEKTLQLLVDTFAYDDFAKIYEKFVHARYESEICHLISELEDFRGDDRLLMILTPLMSHESLKVQSAVNNFMMKINNHTMTEEMVNIIENSDYINSINDNKPDPQAEFFEFKNQGFDDGWYNADRNDHAAVSAAIDKSVFYEEPHKLIIEAYQTKDRDRLFAISCALSQYDDPLVVEALIYINSKLNGDNPDIMSSEPVKIEENTQKKQNIIKSSGSGEAQKVRNFNFTSINEIFKPAPKEITANFAPKNSSADNAQKASGSSSGNDYVKGMKLVNMAKYMKYEECVPEFINNLNHDSVYVRCCAIKAVKTLALRLHNIGSDAGIAELKKSLMSHMMVTEKNSEVISLCSKALLEIEALANAPRLDGETGEMRNEFAYQSVQAKGLAEALNDDAANL